MSTSFWKDKRVVVTGGAGFLGSHVVEELSARGIEPAQIFVPRKREYDLRELEAVRRLLRETRPHLVIHLAANVGGIGANRKKPGEFFYDNLMMGVPLLHESWRAGVEKFVAVGTICAYPKWTPVPFHEDELWNGYPEETNAPYGLAKKMLLVQAQAYRAQYGFNAICLLPVNLYGPRDNFDEDSSHVIPALIRKFVEAKEKNAETITAWGDGTPTREFLFVRDAAQAIVLATEKYDGAQPVNIGSGTEISMRDLAHCIAREVGFDGEITWDSSQPNGQMRRCLDTTRAREYFGFQAQTSFAGGLRETIRWYAENRSA